MSGFLPFHSFIRLIVLLGLIAALTGCASAPTRGAADPEEEQPTAGSEPVSQENGAPMALGPADDDDIISGLSLPETAGLCPFGVPVMGDSWQDLQLTFIVRDGYWLMHDDALKTPIWICEELLHADVHGPLSGRENWCADPELCGASICNPSHCDRGSVNRDYVGSGFDRGHLAPDMNQRGDRDRKRETFYFSNAAPQVGRNFNQSTWQFFETEMTVHMCVPDRFWTITGLLHLDENGMNRSGEVPIIGGGVAIPSHYFKIVAWLFEDTVDGFVSVMANREYSRDESYRDFIKPIDWLEAVMDIQFLPELPAEFAEILKAEPGVPFEWTRSDCRILCGETANC